MIVVCGDYAIAEGCKTGLHLVIGFRETVSPMVEMIENLLRIIKSIVCK